MKKFAVFLLVLIWSHGIVHATVHNITVGDRFFSPHNTTATQGDTIRWTNVAGIHGMEYVPSGVDFRAVAAAPWVFDMVVILAPGDYPYQCIVHTTSMRDTFHVIAAPEPVGIPEELTIIPDGNDAILRWRAAENASFYQIYTSLVSDTGAFSNQLASTEDTFYVHENVYADTPQRHDVVLMENFFSPSEITVHVGDTIVWTNPAGFHNVRELSAAHFLSSEFPEPGPWVYEYIVAIPAGSYDYQCDAHFSEGMTGVVNVVVESPILYYQVRASDEPIRSQPQGAAPTR